MGPNRLGQIDGSKQTDWSKLVQIGPLLSHKLQNQPKKCLKGSGTTRSPGLVLNDKRYSLTNKYTNIFALSRKKDLAHRRTLDLLPCADRSTNTKLSQKTWLLRTNFKDKIRNIAELQIKPKSKSNQTKNLERLYNWVVVVVVVVVVRTRRLGTRTNMSETEVE